MIREGTVRRNAHLIAQAFWTPAEKGAADTDAWRDKPDILAVCPCAYCARAYESLVFRRNALGGDVREKAAAWHRNWSPWFCWARAAFWTQGACPVWKHRWDGTPDVSAHGIGPSALVEALENVIK